MKGRVQLSNGPRLSCGRNRRWRKEVEAETKARGRGNAILPYLRAPVSFKRLLGSAFTSALPQLDAQDRVA